MDSLLALIHSHAEIAHWIMFFLLILAGFNLPISEDFIVITAGILSSTLIPENTYTLFLWIFLGCYLSDWISYGLGRKLGPKLLKVKWFSRSLKPSRMKKVSSFYERYGMWTLGIGRFIPFGVRNLLFFSAGMSKMNFWKFIISDGLACIFSNFTLFYLAYSFSKNYDALIGGLKVFKITILVIATLLILGLVLFFHFRKLVKKRKMENIS